MRYHKNRAQSLRVRCEAGIDSAHFVLSEIAQAVQYSTWLFYFAVEVKHNVEDIAGMMVSAIVEEMSNVRGNITIRILRGGVSVRQTAWKPRCCG